MRVGGVRGVTWRGGSARGGSQGAPGDKGSVESGVPGESDGATSCGGRGVIGVTEMGGDGEPWSGSGFVSEAVDGDGGPLEDAAVEGGRSSFKEGGNLVAGAEGGPAAARALEREPLGERLCSAAPAAEGNRAEGVRSVACVDVGGANQGSEGEGTEVRRLPGSGLPGRANEGMTNPALAAVV